MRAKRMFMATVVALLAAMTLTPVPTHAAEPDPVMNLPVFNDPWGTTAAQNANFIQFARLIDRVPAGEEIVLSWFGFDTVSTTDSADDPDLTARLLRAHDRGVQVKVILDQSQVGNDSHTRLKAALGADDTQPSWIVTCQDQFPSGPKRGCIGTRVKEWSNGPVYAYNHNKFAAFSRLVMNDGSTVPDVVFTGSSNIGEWDAVEAYNDMFTFTDTKVYAAFRDYFEDLRAFRHSATGDNDYYVDTGTGSAYRAFFFPRAERAGRPFEDPGSDTVYNTLQSVDPSCRYQETDGSWHQTDLRVVMLSFNRPAIAQKLADLSGSGCWVDVVYAEANKAVLDAFAGSGAQLTFCDFDNDAGERDLQVHSKTLLIDGKYDDDITPRVYTGSHNYAWSALRQADEVWLRITGRQVHDRYLQNFWKIRDTCKGRA